MRNIVVVLACMLGAARAESVSNVCTGTCVITNPIYVNVFWDTSEDQWNRDIVATDAGATVARVSSVVQAILKSGYWSPDLQYYGVGSPSVAPPIVEGGCSSPAPTIADNLAGALSPIALFASCVMSHHRELDPNRTILNVFFPPAITGGSGWCPGAGGSHNFYFVPLSRDYLPDGFIPVQTVVMPTNSACHPGTQPVTGLESITGALTHEMVEAATDPSPDGIGGWRSSVLFGKEIGDICEPESGYRTPFLCSPVPGPGISKTAWQRDNQRFPCGMAYSYWSNFSNTCMNGITPPVVPMPVIDKAEVCGTGKAMRITLTGNLDNTPWDLGPNGHGGDQTMFLQALVTGRGKPGTSVGGIANSPPDTIGFGKITWTPAARSATKNKVVIEGFDDRLGTATLVAPGDRVRVTLWSPSNGQPAFTTITAPSPTRISDLKGGVSSSSPSHWTYIDQPTSIFGKLVDRGGCAIGGVTVTAASSDGTFASGPSAMSGNDGRFSIGYMATGVAGPHSVKIVAPLAGATKVDAHPLAVQLSSLRGGTAGGQTITLYGDGFGPGVTNVWFRDARSSTAATAVTVIDGKSLKLTTPVHAAGTVDVVVTVNGLDSDPLSYEYIVPHKPVLTFLPATCRVSGNAVALNQLQMDAYLADGTESPTRVALSASYAAFVAPSMGQPSSSISVAPGTTAGFYGVGPVTATSAASSLLTVTATFTQGPLISCLSGVKTAQIVDDVPDYGLAVESQVIDGARSTDGMTVAWGIKNESGLVFTSKDKSAVTTAATIEVRAPGTRELRATARAHPGALIVNGSADTRVHLLGPSLSLSAKSGSGGLPAPASLAFRLPPKSDPTRVRIVRLVPGGSWVETPSTIGQRNGQSAAGASVQEAGTYALARIDHAEMR